MVTIPLLDRLKIQSGAFSENFRSVAGHFKSAQGSPHPPNRIVFRIINRHLLSTQNTYFKGVTFGF